MDPNIKKRPANVNPDTGTPYGAIALNTLDQDIVETLQYGRQATNVTYEAAKAEYLAVQRREFESEQSEGLHEDEEFDDEHHAQMFSDNYQGDEEQFAGEYEGVQYQTFWLGGAPHLWVFKSPFVRACRPCSPCVPNAGDLSSEGGYIAYDVPPEWRASK